MTSTKRKINPEDVREVYIYFRRKIPGQADYNSAERWDITTSIWKKIANFLEENNCDDLWGFIASGFRLEIGIYPNMFLGSKAWERYEKYLSICRKLLPKRLLSDCWSFFVHYNQIRRYRNSAETLTLILSDATVPISALFRYILASIFGQDSVKSHYFKAARDQLYNAPVVYKETWPVPPELWRIE